MNYGIKCIYSKTTLPLDAPGLGGWLGTLRGYETWIYSAPFPFPDINQALTYYHNYCQSPKSSFSYCVEEIGDLVLGFCNIHAATDFCVKDDSLKCLKCIEKWKQEKEAVKDKQVKEKQLQDFLSAIEKLKHKSIEYKKVNIPTQISNSQIDMLDLMSQFTTYMMNK